MILVAQVSDGVRLDGAQVLDARQQYYRRERTARLVFSSNVTHTRPFNFLPWSPSVGTGGKGVAWHAQQFTRGLAVVWNLERDYANPTTRDRVVEAIEGVQYFYSYAASIHDKSRQRTLFPQRTLTVTPEHTRMHNARLVGPRTPHWHSERATRKRKRDVHVFLSLPHTVATRILDENK